MAEPVCRVSHAQDGEWPVTTLRLTLAEDELCCPRCGETRLVERIGSDLYCAVCGSTARDVGRSDPSTAVDVGRPGVDPHGPRRH